MEITYGLSPRRDEAGIQPHAHDGAQPPPPTAPTPQAAEPTATPAAPKLSPYQRAMQIYAALDTNECEDWFDLAHVLGVEVSALQSECISLRYDHSQGQVDPEGLTRRMAFWKVYKTPSTETQSEINARLARKAAEEGITIQ